MDKRFLIFGFLVAMGVMTWVVGIEVFKKPEPQVNFGSARQNATAVNLFGTKAAKQSLVGGYVTSTIMNVRGYDKVIIGGTYTPATNNAYLVLHLEGSVDDGSNFFPLSTKIAGTTEIDVFADGGTGMSSATSGIPFIIPGDKTSTANQPVTSTMIELENVAYTHIRITPNESVSTGNGTLWLQGGGKIDN